jgi:hypothetical protein
MLKKFLSLLLIPILLGSTQSEKPSIHITAPSIVLSQIMRPTEILLRVRVEHPPQEQYFLWISWGDGETSGQTLDEGDEGVVHKSHKYKITGDIDIVVILTFDGKKSIAYGTHTLHIT